MSEEYWIAVAYYIWSIIGLMCLIKFAQFCSDKLRKLFETKIRKDGKSHEQAKK